MYAFVSAHQGRRLVAMRPPGDRAVTGQRCRTPLYNGPDPAKMRLFITLTCAVTPPTLQVTAPR